MDCITKFAPLDTWQQFQSELSSELSPDSLESVVGVLRGMGYNSPKDIRDMTLRRANNAFNNVHSNGQWRRWHHRQLEC